MEMKDLISGVSIKELHHKFKLIHEYELFDASSLTTFFHQVSEATGMKFLLQGSFIEGLYYKIPDLDVMIELFSIDIHTDPTRLEPVQPGGMRVKAYDEDNTDNFTVNLETVTRDGSKFYNSQHISTPNRSQ